MKLTILHTELGDVMYATNPNKVSECETLCCKENREILDKMYTKDALLDLITKAEFGDCRD